MSAEQARDLLEIIEDRMDAGSILVTSQVPVDRWHDMIGLTTIADAIPDRLVHNAYRIELKGELAKATQTRPHLIKQHRLTAKAIGLSKALPNW